MTIGSSFYGCGESGRLRNGLVRRADMLIGFAVLCGWTMLGRDAYSATVQTHDVVLNETFSQASFGNQPITFRIEPVIDLVDPSLFEIDSPIDFAQLFVAAARPATHINAYYVDEINWCGSTAASAVGCASEGGWVLAVENAVVSGGFGAELLAHEIGHNLGLSHTAGEGLMGPVLNGEFGLTISEAQTILASPLVQTDNTGSFVQIQPIRVLAAVAVPEPSFALCGSAFVSLCVLRRRRSQVTV